MNDLRELLTRAGEWIANSEAPGSAEVAAEIEAHLAATTDEPGLRAAVRAFIDEYDRLGARLDEEWAFPTDELMALRAALALTPAASDGSLDVAWTAAEAAMPDGWRIRSLILMGRRWEAVAAEGGRGSGREIYIAHGPTPTAALRALAARLSESPSEGKPE